MATLGQFQRSRSAFNAGLTYPKRPQITPITWRGGAVTTRTRCGRIGEHGNAEIVGKVARFASSDYAKHL
jgi:hypothetical protein